MSAEDTKALRFGSAWARAMESRWLGADYEAAYHAGVPDGVSFDELELATFSGMLAGYFRSYGTAQEDSLITKCHPEVEFCQPLSGSRTFTIAGKMDGLCVLRDGRLADKEDKTTSDSIAPDSDYWLRLRFNTQLMQYVLAARPMGWNVECCIYDVTRKPCIEPRQIPCLDDKGLKIVMDASGNRVMKKDGSPRESGDSAKGYTLLTRTETPDEYNTRLFNDTLARPDFYFARREVPIIEQDLDEFSEQRLTMARMVLHCRASEKRFAQPERAWPRNVSEMTCRHCFYQSFCLQNLSVDINNPPPGFKVGDPNPELKGQQNV